MFWTAQKMATGFTIGLCLGLWSAAMAQETLRKPDAAFLKTAAVRQQSEIQLGQLAAERSENEQVKQFAQRMVQDHTKASQEIGKLAATLGLTLPEIQTDEQDKKTRKFSSLSGAAFDRAYIKHEMADHKKNVNEFAAKSKALKNPQVREWVSATLPVLKEHLSLAKGLAIKSGKAGAKRTGTHG